MYLRKFCHCVSLVRDFALLSHFSCKKLRFSYILQDFLFGIGIWIWAVEILRSSHYASIVRALKKKEQTGEELQCNCIKDTKAFVHFLQRS